MIIIEAVNTTGMFSCGLMPTIDLRKRGNIFIRGMNLDRGGSNGAGKSSIPNAIKEILFGENDTPHSGEAIVNTHMEWENGCCGICWFTDARHDRWRVLYLRKWKGELPDVSARTHPSTVLRTGGSYTGTDVFIERWNGTEWTDERPTSLGNKTLKDAQAKVVEVIGMTYEQFSSYVCLGQSAESALVSGTSGDREKIIQSVVDVSVWDKAADLIKTKYTDLEMQASSLKAQISASEAVLATLGTYSQQDLDAAKMRVAELEYDLQQHSDGIQTAQQESQVVKDRFVRANQEMQSAQMELDILSAEERHSYERFQRWQAPAEPPELIIISEQGHNLAFQLSSASVALNRYKTLNAGQCDKCGLDVRPEHINKHRAEAEQTVHNLQHQITQMEARRVELLKQHTAAVEKSRIDAKAKLDLEIAGVNQSRQRFQAAMQAPALIRQEITSCEQKLSQLQYAKHQTSTMVADATRRVNELTSHLARRDEVITRLKADADQIDIYLADVTHLKWVERHMRRVRIHEYDSALQRLNQLLAEKMRLLCPAMMAQFVTAQTKAAGKGVKQGIDLIVTSDYKEPMPIGLFSGGERKSIVVAMFKAMRQLISERGGGVNLAIIDELDADLDDPSIDRMVESFESLASDADTCLIISHKTRLQNTMKFDAEWTVIKQVGFSTIELPQAHSEAA